MQLYRSPSASPKQVMGFSQYTEVVVMNMRVLFVLEVLFCIESSKHGLYRSPEFVHVADTCAAAAEWAAKVHLVRSKRAAPFAFGRIPHMI